MDIVLPKNGVKCAAFKISGLQIHISAHGYLARKKFARKILKITKLILKSESLLPFKLN